MFPSLPASCLTDLQIRGGTLSRMSTPKVLRPDAQRVREALVARRERLRSAWAEHDECGDAIVFVPSGLVVGIEGSDQPYEFRGHDDHAYLAGAREPGQVLVHDPEEGWMLFAHVASQEDRVWHGATPEPEAQAEALGVERAQPTDELGAWLADRAGRPAALLGSRDVLERPIGYGLHPGDLEALAFDADLSERVEARVHQTRRRKDEVELDFLRAAAACSAAGHQAGMERARAGMSERALQVEIETGFRRAGAERPAYATIAVSGPNTAVLHATPGDRTLQDGDLVLVDAGAEVGGYDSDVTRTWPVASAFTPSQRALYEIVLEVQQAAIEEVAAGVEFRELHLAACRRLAAGLVDFGLLIGDPDGLVERDTHALFFPHGLGHMLGLATHDVGGWAHGRERSKRPGLEFLRIDTPLAVGDVVTIEPGLYFVPALLSDVNLRHEHHDAVNWELADTMAQWGGIRIEDDVLVTEEGRDVLTSAIPKTVDGIEAMRAS